MRLYVQTLPDLHDAMYMYYQWVTLRQLVYAVDIRHNCDDPEFEAVTNNEHSIMKVILFDNNSYYYQITVCYIDKETTGIFISEFIY